MDNRNFENNENMEKVPEKSENMETQPTYEQNAPINGQSFSNPYNAAPGQNMSQRDSGYNTYSRPEPTSYGRDTMPPQPGMVKYDIYSGERINNNVRNEIPPENPYSLPVTEKKKSKGRSFGIIAAALILSLCVGVGGGFLGSYIANGNSALTSESSQAEDKKDSNDKDDSVLKITQASDSDVTPTTTQEVAAKVKDAVVEITTEATAYDSFYGQYVQQSAGSGVIISDDGYIITNNHVIEGANKIQVRLTNTNTYTAKLIGRDSTLDVALLKIEETGLTAATFGDSAKLSVGQTAIAIGNPLGQLGGTVTDGIISALDREIKIDNKTMNLLQTNAAINPGNSGGGLFDSNGNLIGIVVAKSSSTSSGTSVEGLGFAIPVNDIVDILDDLKTKGYVGGRAYLGINFVDITDQQSMFMYRVDKAGVYVSAVTEGSAAEKAGIKIYDCITKVDDEEIDDSSELRTVISKHKAGDKVKITVYRDGETKVLDVTLGEKAAEEEESSEVTEDYNPYQDFFR